MVKITIFGRNAYPCRVGFTAGMAIAAIRDGYLLVGGFIIKNGIAMGFDEIITEDGEYHFIEFRALEQGLLFYFYLWVDIYTES